MKKTFLFIALFPLFAAAFFGQESDASLSSDASPLDGRPLYELPQKEDEPLPDEDEGDESEVASQEEAEDDGFEASEVVVDNPEELRQKPSESASSDEKEKEKKKINLAGLSEVPPAKRPKKPDPEKARIAEEKDDNDSKQKTRDTIKYGIEGELIDLVKKLMDDDDPRYSDDLYDLFKQAKSPAVREKILEYFAKLEDPCLEDYAVEILNDPYEERKSTVEQCFRYIAAVKTKAAVPAVVTLLESENENYFGPSLSALGEIGGETEAKYLVEFLDRSDLTVSQRQQLMRVLGKIKAVETWDALVEIAEDDGENAFVRMYAAEAIGAMEKPESVPVLIKLFETNDSNLRCYVLKGLKHFPQNSDARDVVVQAVKDGQYKVRLEAIDASCEMKIKEAVPYICYRAQNDPEASVKQKAYESLAKYENDEAEKFLVDAVSDKKSSDTVKRQASEVLLKYSKAGRAQIAELAESLSDDDRKKPFRYAVGKLIAKYPDPAFSRACQKFISSKDTATCALGLDMYSSGKYSGARAFAEAVAEDKKAGANKKKAMKILGIEEEPEGSKKNDSKGAEKNSAEKNPSSKAAPEER